MENSDNLREDWEKEQFELRQKRIQQRKLTMELAVDLIANAGTDFEYGDERQQEENKWKHLALNLPEEIEKTLEQQEQKELEEEEAKLHPDEKDKEGDDDMQFD